MKIAIVGYGKMGHIIEKTAMERGHEITCRIDKDNTCDFNSPEFRNSDVAIEFSTPATGAENVLKCMEVGVPVVSGTTGWTARLPEMRKKCERGEGTLIWASNFSIGVNIFMTINSTLARIMNKFPQYTPSMLEVHHIHKLDHPSGTAITLAEEIEAGTERITGWVETETEAASAPAGKLGIAHERRGEVPGIHTITWDSSVDDITISHSAKSRDGFALGAVIAAEWLADKKGFHTMPEMMASLTGISTER
ncbi:MAG: 4-hydroxy-tetrahydrodipicolinate reductase [Candidatus Amulumruptor caecigallinarius]|nr:4-hydroxy-tetrahydrodipicolinate reductase [Candidatus Amulumruptor caecigallinarius]